MRIHIDGHPYAVSDWFADKENITCETATQEMETEKAVLLNMSDGRQQWIPKSQLSEITEDNGDINKY